MKDQIEETTTKTQNYSLEFFGKGSEFFSIMIVNWLLTIITFGLYYPWARAKNLRYIYGQTALNNERFHFSGTGKEMFIGFLKIIGLYIVFILLVFAILFIATSSGLTWMIILANFLPYLAILAIIPFAIHGSLRYRMSRTSYRSIRLGYRGNRNELVKNYYKWIFFTIITLGIYGAWLSMNFRRFTHKHIRYGDVEFSNNCNGLDWLLLNLKGYLLSIITIGIYTFWWQRDMFNYYWNNLKLKKGDQNITCRSIATGGGFFELLIGNLLIIVFTLGLGSPWAYIRTQKFICDNVEMEGDINLDEIQQTEEQYNNALGEDAMDYLDLEV